MSVNEPKQQEFFKEGRPMSGSILYSNSSTRQLAGDISRVTGYPLRDAVDKSYSDGEARVQLSSDTRGRVVFVIGSTHQPDRNLFEMLMIIRAARKAAADYIVAVFPYFGYSRADYKDRPRVCPTTKLVCDLIASSGVDHVLTVDLHSPQIQEFFTTRVVVDQLYSTSIFAEHFSDFDWTRTVILAPDNGSIKNARKLRDFLDAAGLGFINKSRPKPNMVDKVVNINMEIGTSIKEMNVLIIDDMSDTSGTICNSAVAAKENGAARVEVAFAHGVLSGEALDRLAQAPIDRLWLTNSIPGVEQKVSSLPYDVKIIDLAPTLGEAIRRTYNRESISSLIKM